MLSPQRRKQLSKLLSLILRHEPERFSLSLDEHGFVPLSDLLAAVRRQREWDGVTEEQIQQVVATSDRVPAQRVMRFEIIGERIRARYGHSVPRRLAYAETEPPEILFHGTSSRSLPAIRAQGLQPMQRQYVHLSTAEEQARSVGRRHGPEPVVLLIRARAAWQAGVRFYRPEERLYLSTAIPPQFVEDEHQ